MPRTRKTTPSARSLAGRSTTPRLAVSVFLCLAVLALAQAVAPAPARAQGGGDIGAATSRGRQGQEAKRTAVLAVAEAALAAITREDISAFADLMLPEAVTYSVLEREGVARYTSQTRDGWAAMEMGMDILERGFEPDVLIQGPVALVWLPYDLYIDGEWSHCGVDTFTMVRTPDGWRIAAMAWTVEQPPACRPHPDGPPTP